MDSNFYLQVFIFAEKAIRGFIYQLKMAVLKMFRILKPQNITLINESSTTNYYLKTSTFKFQHSYLSSVISPVLVNFFPSLNSTFKEYV